jgi:hypothetical protein
LDPNSEVSRIQPALHNINNMCIAAQSLSNFAKMNHCAVFRTNPSFETQCDINQEHLLINIRRHITAQLVAT